MEGGVEFKRWVRIRKMWRERSYRYSTSAFFLMREYVSANIAISMLTSTTLAIMMYTHLW